jgi:integrase
MSSVRKRILPTREVRWLLDYKDGQGRRRAKQFRTKSEATAFETKVRAEVAAGTHVADSAAVTVREAGDLWLQRARMEGLEASTIRQYRQHLDHHVLPQLGALKLSRLTKPAVEEFRDWLLQSRSRALTRKILTSLKGILSEAQRRGLTVQNVATGTKVTIARRHEEKIEIPAKEEVRAIIKKANELWPATSALPWRAFIITAIFTGLRASELRGLSWDHVNFAEKVINVRQRADFKNKLGRLKSAAAFRSVPMSPIVANTLKQWRLAAPKSEHNLVFPTGNGTIISNSNMHRQCWRRILRALNLICCDTGGAENAVEKPKYTFHHLRHVAASLFIEQNWSAKKVQAVMGHSSIKVTYDLYGHLWPTAEDDQEAMKQIEARLLS